LVEARPDGTFDQRVLSEPTDHGHHQLALPATPLLSTLGEPALTFELHRFPEEPLMHDAIVASRFVPPARPLRTLLGLTACAVLFAVLLIAGAPPAQAKGPMYFRDGVGASAKVYWRNLLGGRVEYWGRLWDKKGDGRHARIYRYSNGSPLLLRRATFGGYSDFSGSTIAPVHFRVCTFKGNVMIRCTWTATDH
jgi:hypothetical protein